MTLFEYTDYKIFLKNYLRQLNRRGAITELARSAGCSHSYLSQVLNGKPELTPDQAMAAADFLKLDTEEAKFFLNLVLLSRSSTQKLKKHFEAQLKALKDQKFQLKTAVSAKADFELEAKDRDYYYSSCTVQIIHTLTACSNFQTVSSIASRLNLNPKDVTDMLDWLVKRSLVKKKENRYLHSGKSVHLPTESIHNRINHLNWRLKGLESSEHTGAIHYTSTFSIERKDIEKIRANLLTFIEGQREEISKSGSEEMMTFCCDLF